MSRRALGAVAAAVALVLAVGAVWWWNGRGPDGTEERVTDLVQSTYDIAYEEVPDPTLLAYGRDSFETGCDDVDGDRFVGSRAASQVDPDVDWLAGVESIAVELDGEGWDVARWWWLDADADRDERIVAARRGSDRVVVAVNANSIDLTASSGPCLDALERFDPAGEFRSVDTFDG